MARVSACSEEHDEDGHLTEDIAERIKMTDKRNAKLAAMEKEMNGPAVGHPEAAALLVGWGTARGAIEEAVDLARSQGKKVSSVHLRFYDEVRAVAEKELSRLTVMSPAAAEYSVTRNYLDWLVDLPWAKSSKDRIDIARAKSVLEKDHYGLDKVKNRILEYLSVRKLNPKMKGPILCFVGPPGVGKTSMHSFSREMPPVRASSLWSRKRAADIFSRAWFPEV